MMRYYFFTEDGACYPDTDGVELPSLEAAKREATRHLGQMLRDKPEMLWETGDLKILVKDNRGLVLFSLQTTTIGAAATLHWTSKAPV